MSAPRARAALTPAARALAGQLSAAFPPLGPGTDIPALRRATAQEPARLPAVASVTDRTIPGPAGAPPLPVRIYRDRVPADGTAEAPPVVVFFHGGGFVLCDLETHDGLCRALAAGTGAVVVSVAYRLAPEHPAPAAVEDAYAALRWAADPGSRHGGDHGRVAVAGDSAGANLAAMACLTARDRRGPAPVAQLLAYPALDPRLRTRSAGEFGTGHFLTTAHLRWYWEQYLGGAAPSAAVSPSLATDLRGLPPALLVEAECDPLRDEGREYAARLPRAEVHTAPGMFHGFLAYAQLLPEAAEALAASAAWLRARLAPAAPVQG
ncbi:alpha/beta hydrolase [Streptomyces albidoflavus]